MAVTETTELSSRAGEILAAVDYLIQVHDDWEADESSPDVPTEAFENALVDLAERCSGDLPMRCRDVATAVARLTFEWNEFANGVRTRDRKPVPRFWAAFRQLLTAREAAVIRPLRRPEPVSVLLDQKVSYQQIAFYIWGSRGKGPLVTPAGQPDIDAIHREAKEPGSVIPEDWHHPDELARYNRATAHSQTRIQAVKRIEDEAGELSVDPASIEDLLKEGQFPNVIARVKRVSVEEVYRIAKLKGIKPNEAPNLAAIRGPQEPQLTGDEDRSLQPRRVEPPQPKLERSRVTQPEDSSNECNATIIKMFSEGGRSNSEIQAALAESGVTVSIQKVNAVIREHRRRATATEVTGEPTPAPLDEGSEPSPELFDMDSLGTASEL